MLSGEDDAMEAIVSGGLDPLGGGEGGGGEDGGVGRAGAPFGVGVGVGAEVDEERHL